MFLTRSGLSNVFLSRDYGNMVHCKYFLHLSAILKDKNVSLFSDYRIFSAKIVDKNDTFSINICYVLPSITQEYHAVFLEPFRIS